jgi:phage shock protein C
MVCPRCGMKLAPTSQSCSACGLTASEAYWQSRYFARLVRPIDHRIFGGVCAAIALHYGWKISRVRIVTVFLMFFTGIGLFAYLAAWFVIPQEPYPTPNQST